MLCPNFLSADVPYRTVAQYFAEVSHQLLPTVSYNEAILAPDGFECIDRLDGLFTSPDGGLYPDSGTIIVTGWTRQYTWPGWNRLRWEFDGETGQFLRRGKAPGGYYANDVRQGAGGELWLQLILGHLQLLGPDYQPTGEMLVPSDFGAIDFEAPLVDLARDRLVSNVNVEDTIRIYRISTGEELHSLLMPDKPVDICYEDGSRAYVLTDKRQVFLIDYEAGRIMGAVKLGPGSDLWNQNTTRMAWDNRYQRLLLVSAPADRGYAYTTAITGYRMRPVHTHLCTPIPLDRQRAGQSFRVLLKGIGDRSEGLPGFVNLDTPLAGPNAAGLDGNGEAVVRYTGAAEGAATITATLDTPCLP